MEQLKLIASNSNKSANTSSFIKISFQEREEVKKWVKKQNPKLQCKKRFLSIVKEALRKVNYDYWISTIEASKPNDKIEFVEGEDVAVGYTIEQWTHMANSFCKERGSRISNLHELFIWYTWRIVKGYWTFDEVAKNSSFIGNYWHALGSAHIMEKAGVRLVGGFKDGQGNTYKLVTYKSYFVCVGGCYNTYGNLLPIAHIREEFNTKVTLNYTVAIVTLIK